MAKQTSVDLLGLAALEGTVLVFVLLLVTRGRVIARRIVLVRVDLFGLAALEGTVLVFVVEQERWVRLGRVAGGMEAFHELVLP